MLRRLLLPAVLIIAFILVTYVFLQSGTRYESAIEKGLLWLSTYSHTYENPGVFWVLDDIDKRYCPHKGIEEMLESRFEKETQTPASVFYHALRTESKDVEVPPLDSVEKYDQWLISALSCRTHSLSPTIQKELLDSTLAGYDLTHQYIALTYFERLSCAGTLPIELSSFRQSIAERIQSEDETAHHTFSDISAERAAFLLWGGHRELVSEEWVRTIAHSQETSGGWKNIQSDTSPNPHTTALALWALVQYGGACGSSALYSQTP